MCFAERCPTRLLLNNFFAFQALAKRFFSRGFPQYCSEWLASSQKFITPGEIAKHLILSCMDMAASWLRGVGWCESEIYEMEMERQGCRWRVCGGIW